ncbi:MAG: LPS-assembly protein LptD [Acidobacteriota bacterium]|nr:LPS-assembly protein LptD [Acidobacteriota bacterium]
MVQGFRRSYAGKRLCVLYFFITIMVTALRHPQAAAQALTTEAPVPTPAAASAPESPPEAGFPVATVLPPPAGTSTVVIEADQQSERDGHYTLDGHVVLRYGDRTFAADHVEYDTESGEVTATGHIVASGGRNDELLYATRGTLNVKTQRGSFDNVTGSVGIKPGAGRLVYANGNPFLFSGRRVVKTGPQAYEVYGGTVTSCRLDHPDWVLSASKFTVDSEMARASNSVFRLLNIPLLYLPYVTQPVDVTDRQSGLLIPVVGESSTKGLVLGEQIYFALGRSQDLTVGAQYFSLRGWEQMATYRFKGYGDDFAMAHYSGLLDRGYYTGGSFVNQGGEDVTFAGRHDLSGNTRVAATAEYLSSYPYREAFTENFNQAVSTDILSVAYAQHQSGGYVVSALTDKYQGLKRIPVGTTQGQEIKIFHLPSVEFAAMDHALGISGLRWSLESTAAGLKRVEPNFATSGVVERLDVHPMLSYPVQLRGWSLLPSVGVRETFYSRSRQTPPQGTPAPPVQSTAPLGRGDVEVGLDLRAPVLERTFDSPFTQRFFGTAVRHTIEPSLNLRYVGGVNSFKNVLRFDAVDVVSNTRELEYGTVQRLFLKPRRAAPCTAADLKPEAERVKDAGDVPANGQQWDCGSREWITWQLAQKYFFDESFGGAVVNGRRNIFDTTLNLSGVAFLTEPRAISPLISRLRFAPTEKVDVEWDFDLDTGAKKFTSNNLLVDFHKDDVFGGLSFARLSAPGRSYSQGVSVATSDFNQLRILAGYGAPTKRGLSVGANAGLDLILGTVEYGTLETSYNWDCCGLSVEYRKYELGSARNESVYRFNFTLANIGTAGNLKRAERLF